MMIKSSQMRTGEKYTDCYTEKDIDDLLKIIFDNIRQGNYTITERRGEANKNHDFKKRFNLSKEQRKQMLLELTAKDFLHSMLDDRNEKEILYVFGKTYNLWDAYLEPETYRNVETYIKFCNKDLDGDSLTVVISMHEAEYKLQYCFKK